MNKYHAKRAVYRGDVFDSRKEARRFAELSLLEKGGHIKDLRRQVVYELIPAQYKDVPDGIYTRGALKGQPRYKTVCVERAVKYIADFVYMLREKYETVSGGVPVVLERWREVVEDTKSDATRTPEYIIKRKLMRYLKNIEITEV